MSPGGHGFTHLFTLVGRHRGRLALVLAVSLAASALALVQPWLTKRLIDEGLIGRRLDLVVVICAQLLGAALLSFALGAFNRWHYLTLSGAVLFSLRERVFGHILRLPPTFAARRGTGDVLSRLDGDVAEIQRFAVDGVLAAVNAALVLAGTLAVMAMLSPVLMLPALVMLPLQVVLTGRLRPRLEGLTRKLRERSGALSRFLVESLQTVKLAQSVGGEGREQARLAALNRGYLGDLRRVELFALMAGGLPGLLGGVAVAAVFVMGGAMVAEGTMSVGALVAFTLYLGKAGGPVSTLMGLMLAQRRARVSLERVAAILDEPVAVINPPNPVRLPPAAAGAIRLDGVGFSYGGCPPVLNGLDGEIPAGAKVALVGVSGIGKTTLIDLLHRHYDPQSGGITLDGIDLRRLDLGELRRRIAVVAQDSPLVAGTIADNIRYANPLASDAMVMAAADRAEIAHLDLAAPVAERGVTLSGGECQRLALARALLQDPLVLILDEAVSAVDRESGQRLCRMVDTLFADKTRIVVSHHPDALAGADLVFELSVSGLAVRRWEPAA
ncbi:2-phenylethylamine uptake protein PeaH [Candidatus Terasakiella magnetica]|nr:2-phenylethylamine uptake protein PeaH [Candidatus Terasakiella magnetica]